MLLEAFVQYLDAESNNKFKTFVFIGTNDRVYNIDHIISLCPEVMRPRITKDSYSGDFKRGY